MKKINLDEFKNKAKASFDKAKETAGEVKTWVVEHPQETITLVGFGVALVKSASNVYSKHQTKQNLRAEQDMKDLYMYDHSKGRYQRLNHPMTPNEAIEYERRRKEGETFMEALMNMRLV